MKDVEYKRFENEYVSGGVTVYTETKEHAGRWGQEQKAPTINWSCCGEVTIEEAEAFLELFKNAVEYAKIQKEIYYK